MVLTEEYTRIINELKNFPDGAHLAQIHEKLAFCLPKRTLQRRLAELVKSKAIITTGEGRACRYFMSASENNISNKQIRYHRSFVDNYEPNVTYYLSAAERSQLLQWGTPPKLPNKTATFVKKILRAFLIDLSWNSSRLEGNTYSLLETERLLDSGEVAQDKDPLDAQMLLNHKAAIEFLVEQDNTLRINTSTILNLHALLSDNLLADPSTCGRLRNIAVGIGKTSYVPLAIPQLIEEMFNNILEKARAIQDPFEQSFFLMVQLPYLQPFIDVNKRVSRLSANIPLIRDGLCPLSFVDVPHKNYIEGILGVYEFNHVERLKKVYMEAYERSCMRYSTLQETGDPN
jgi:hypothetical protein